MMETLVALATAYFAATTFGIDVGYSLFAAHDRLQAQIYGGLTAGMMGWIAGYILVWPIVRNVGNTFIFSPLSRGKLSLQRATGRKSDLISMDDKGGDNFFATIIYRGVIDRDFHWSEGGHKRTRRFRVDFSLSRNKAAMAPRERLAVEIFQKLDAGGYIDRASYDRLQFGLCWGDGRGSVDQISTVRRVPIALNITASVDFIPLEARYRNAGCESAINELFNRLHTAAQQRNAPEAITSLHQSLTGGSDPWAG